MDNQVQNSNPNIQPLKDEKAEFTTMVMLDDNCRDLLNASTSSLEFWNNPIDDIWNAI